MSEFEVVPVSVKCEWNNGRYCWWVRIVTQSTFCGVHEQILLVNEGLEVERNAVFDGELLFSKEDRKLYKFVPQDLEVYFPQWIAVHGEGAVNSYVNVLHSLRRMCRNASLLCASIRSGFNVDFKVRTLASILQYELFQRLEGIDESIPVDLLVVDLHELIVYLLRCVISAGNFYLFDEVFSRLSGNFVAVNWIHERGALLRLLQNECDDMTEWMSYLDSPECYKAARSEIADFEMINAILVETSRASRTRRL